MKKLGKILLWTAITLIVLLAIGISLTIGWRPILGARARPLTARQFEPTPQRLERGRGICSLRQRDAPDATPCTTGVSMAGRCRRVAKASVR
jgi:hypothetical protein